MEHGAKVNINNTIPSLHYAVFSGDLEMVKEFLKYGAEIHHLGLDQCTPLHMVAINTWRGQNHVEIMEELFKHGASVNAINVNKETPLHGAAKEGNFEIVKGLLKHKADVDVIDVNGLTPLLSAIEKGHVKVIRELLKHKSRIDAKDINEESPIHLAVESGKLSIVSKFLKLSSEISAQHCEGQTALHKAVVSYSEENKLECVKIVRKLLEEPIDLNLKNYEGFTALEIALKMKGYALFKMITCRVFRINSISYPFRHR